MNIPNFMNKLCLCGVCIVSIVVVLVMGKTVRHCVDVLAPEVKED